jgi:dienelactone hydrolase
MMSPRGSPGAVVRLILSVALALCVAVDAALAADSLINIPRQDGSPVPARLYGDWNDGGCPPTVLVSHGLGGSEDGLRYLGEGLAVSGYRVAVMGHRESGRRALIEVMAAREKEPLIADPRKFEGRFMDLDAALSYAVRDCRPALLVLAGHSMGAATVMVEAGATGKVATGAADRFDAYVAISPQGVGWMFDHGAWRNISKPVLMVTGTRDSGYDGDYETRLAAFDGLLPGRKRLAVIPDATHLNLGGVGNKPGQAAVLLVVKEFLLQAATGALAPSGVTEARIVDK